MIMSSSIPVPVIHSIELCEYVQYIILCSELHGNTDISLHKIHSPNLLKHIISYISEYQNGYVYSSNIIQYIYKYTQYCIDIIKQYRLRVNKLKTYIITVQQTQIEYTTELIQQICNQYTVNYNNIIQSYNNQLCDKQHIIDDINQQSIDKDESIKQLQNEHDTLQKKIITCTTKYKNLLDAVHTVQSSYHLIQSQHEQLKQATNDTLTVGQTSFNEFEHKLQHIIKTYNKLSNKCNDQADKLIDHEQYSKRMCEYTQLAENRANVCHCTTYVNAFIYLTNSLIDIYIYIYMLCSKLKVQPNNWSNR